MIKLKMGSLICAMLLCVAPWSIPWSSAEETKNDKGNAREKETAETTAKVADKQPSKSGDKPADKDASRTGGKVSGILIEKKQDSISFKADGDEQPVKYVVPASDKKFQESYKSVFDACRVILTYKKDGETRQVVSIKRQILKETGSMTGDVVKVYNNFWVEVKPKTGVADAFAPGGETFNDKEFMAMLKALKPGESVTITYNTDFERHRIKTMKKNPPMRTKTGDSTPSKK